MGRPKIIELPRIRVACPACDSTQHQTTGTKRRGGRPLRYHRCNRCGGSFKTYEITLEQLESRLRRVIQAEASAARPRKDPDRC